MSTLLLTPSSGPAPLAVIADASASTDTDGTPIATYAFDFGDGSAVVGPQAASSSSHVYATAGTYTVTVTVTDTAGLLLAGDQTDGGRRRDRRQPRLRVRHERMEHLRLGDRRHPDAGHGRPQRWLRSGAREHGFEQRRLHAQRRTELGRHDRGRDVHDSMWARADSPGATLNLRVREYAGSTLVGTATNHLTLTTAWQQLSVAYAPRSVGSSTLDLNAYVSNAPPGNCFYADDIAIVLGSPDSPPTPALAVTPASGTRAAARGG